MGAGERLRVGQRDMRWRVNAAFRVRYALFILGAAHRGALAVAAARGGNLGVLQWARENGCEWDKRVCSQAAEGGHLGVLQWARENGCE